jgi:hypothetical protein
VLSTLLAPAYFTDSNLFCLLVCRMVNVSMQHGMCGASTHGCAYLGIILGPFFHRYSEGYLFGKLACDLVDKHGFMAYRAKVHYAMGTTAFWTQPMTTAIDFTRSSFYAAIETGDLTTACYDMYNIGTLLLLRNDPLDAVWRESEMALDFAREAKYGGAVDIIRSQQRFSVLDPQTEGAVPVRGLRRGPCGSRQGQGAALDHSRPGPVTRLFLLHRADRGGALRERYC